MKKQVNIYVFIIVNVATTIEEFKSSKISKNYLYLKKLFDSEKARVLSEQNQKNHVIDLIKNTELSYMLLYNLSQKKLAKLRRYLNNALNKNWIKLSMSLVNVSIPFVFKKDERLRLCVNYKNLNAIIIKNCYFLLFITKILNRLYEIKRFIKLNLKNVYHRIRIKKNHQWKTTFRMRYCKIMMRQLSTSAFSTKTWNVLNF